MRPRSGRAPNDRGDRFVTIDVALDATALRDAVESVWNDTLGLIVDVAPSTFGPRPSGNLVAWVQFSGEFEGAVTLQTTEAFMRQAASVMFGVEPAAVTREELLDALGELANMVGGVLKAQLPAPSFLSLPTVTDGDPSGVSFPRAGVVERVELTCIGDPVDVALVARH
jgi:chemotaxis protein CheX